MAETTKDTIYVDVDDEITAIIDKVRGSKGKIVALVLPKRASVFQSIVNMKLLKRAADDAKKHLVLITSEAGLLPLAGAVGVHVAKTLTSKPEIPAAPLNEGPDEETADEPLDVPDDEVTTANAGNKPIGELAGAAAAADAIETLEMDNDTPDVNTSAAAKPKGPKDKKLRVPDFDRFRLLLLLGGTALVALIVFLYLALSVLPKATITIKTDASNVNSNVDFTLDTNAKTASDKTLPAKAVQEAKTYTQTANATGQKNNGTKASGSVTMTAGSCSANVPSDIAAGTALTASGLTFVTTESVSFVPVISHGHCTYQGQDSGGRDSISISAQSGGSSSNLSNANFNVYSRSDVSASGSTSGGTDNIVQVVSQADIDGAKAKISTDDSSVKQDLQIQLQQAGYTAISASYSPGTPVVTTSANAGSAASNVTVTEVITYTMFGAKQSDLKTLIDNDIKSQIDTSKQGILSEGLSDGTYKVTNPSATGASVNLQTTGEVGPSLDIASIKSNVAGKQAGDIRSSLKSNPDVTDVTVKMSPFWVTHAPKNVNKITVTVAKPTTNVSK